VPRLVIVADDGSERVIELTERTVQIGRGPGNDIVLPDAHKGVSRTHAELRFRNGRCIIVDLQSQNGTYLNGRRIQHAEVPFDAEIGVGSYRLRLESMGLVADSEEDSEVDEPPSTVGFLQTGGEAPSGVSLPDMSFVRPAPRQPEATVALVAAPRSSIGGLIAAGAIVAALAAVTWTFALTSNKEPISSPLPMPDEPAPTRPVTASDPVTPTPETTAQPVAAATANDVGAPGGVEPSPRTGALTSSRTSSRSVAVPHVGLSSDAPLVARKPGETVDAWRIRTAAFQTRYAYSRAALDRGDFAAAAGGFEAILREEPGFLDVPQLLVRARAGLHDLARDVFESGKRLDAAGEWLGALQKYEQASQIDPEIRDLREVVTRVREKLRIAGEGALARARRFDESSRWGDALKEYERAVQWLPPDDARREMAVSRVEQLKKSAR
jgi:hypothetical protein